MGKGPEYIFGLQRHTDDQSALEKMLVITNHQRNTKKTTVRYHLTPVRMAIIKKTINNKCWWGSEEMGTLVHCWWECTLVPQWKTVWRFLKKNKNRTTIWSSIFTSGYLYPKNKNTNLKRYTHPYVHCPTLFIIANIWKEPKYPSIYEWIKKMWYYIHNGMLILIK